MFLPIRFQTFRIVINSNCDAHLNYILVKNLTEAFAIFEVKMFAIVKTFVSSFALLLSPVKDIGSKLFERKLMLLHGTLVGIGDLYRAIFVIIDLFNSMFSLQSQQHVKTRSPLFVIFIVCIATFFHHQLTPLLQTHS